MLNSTTISPLPFGALGKRQSPHRSEPTIAPPQAPRLLDQVRQQIRSLHFSPHIEEAHMRLGLRLGHAYKAKSISIYASETFGPLMLIREKGHAFDLTTSIRKFNQSTD